MGRWGLAPWASDDAADFCYGALKDLSDWVHEEFLNVTSQGKPFSGATYVALHLFAQVGRVYVWNIDRLDADYGMALDLLEGHARDWAADEFEDDEYRATVNEELDLMVQAIRERHA